MGLELLMSHLSRKPICIPEVSASLENQSCVVNYLNQLITVIIKLHGKRRETKQKIFSY
jgi:hypothetical protein